MGKLSGLPAIHVAVFLFGASGLFGELISLPAPLITLGRVIFAALSLAFVIRFFGLPFKIRSRNDLGGLILAGALLAFHWSAFFHSIQIAGVAVGVLTFATFPAFTSFLEPLFFREKIQPVNLLWACICLLGVSLVVPTPETGLQSAEGVLWGIGSGLSFSLLTLLNRRYTALYSHFTLTFYECVVAALCLLPSVLLFDFSPPPPADWVYLIILGSVFTALAHALFIAGMRSIKAQIASIIAGLEPVYGIILAWLILGEGISAQTALGAIIILSAAYGASRKRRVFKTV